MMKKILTLLLTLVTLSYVGKSQEKTGMVSGTVQDLNAKQMESATVSLLNGKDSTFLKGTKTDAAGAFQIQKISNGIYLVRVTAVGHASYITPAFEVSGNNKQLDKITMQKESKDLALVTVVASKPLIEQKIDRTVVNVDASVSNVGASALEVLEKSPGITIDKDGNISLKGKQAVTVMIDNKLTYLSGTELVNLLKTMNANQLDQIEIMTNPPARYDAAGNSGIINIKTKKNKLKGFNGSLSTGYGQGKYWKTNNSVNLNYRNGKFNSFMNLSYNKNYGFQQLDINRKYKSDDGKSVTAIFDQTSVMKSVRQSTNVKAGIDYYLSDKTTIGFVTTGFISPESMTGNNKSYLKDPQGTVDSIVVSTSQNKERWKNGTANINFRHQFDSAGTELTADLDYATYGSSNRQDFVNASFEPDYAKRNQTQLLGILPININIYSAKTDYAQNVKGFKFEAGLKTSFVKTDNVADYQNLVGGQWQTDYEKTNRFTYSENINAGYVNINKQFKKIGVQAGLRYENTNYNGHQQGNQLQPDSSFRKSYNSFFPTVFVSYAANTKNQFGFNVGRRIDRPAYQDLNPFLFFLDNYTYSAGNPYLRPQFSTNFEVSHTYNNFLTTTVNYSETKNFFTETFQQLNYATIVRQGNIGRRNNAGIAISAQVPVQKWWTAVLYTNYNYSQFEGTLYGEKIKVEAGNLLVNVNNQFKFKNGWSAELSGFYRSKGVEGQIMINPMGQVSTGVSKQVLKNKGSLRFNIRDMFYNQKVSGYINFQQTEAHFWNLRDSRVANITFTYRFGKPLKGQENRKKTGASDEESRVKMGGS